jgi:hypothetical protein
MHLILNTQHVSDLSEQSVFLAHNIIGMHQSVYHHVNIVKEEISRFSSLYAVRLRAHTNELIATLTEPPIRYWPNDLLTRF